MAGTINEVEIRNLAEGVLREHIEHCERVWDKDGLKSLSLELIKVCPTHILLRLASQAMAEATERSRRAREDLDIETPKPNPQPGRQIA